jgi:hypothetical protein
VGRATVEKDLQKHFIILAQPSTLGQPGEGSFHHPKVGIYTLPRRILSWQHTPLAASNYQVQDRIDDCSHIECAWMSSWLCGRNQFFDTISLTVGQIDWIQLVLFHIPSVLPRSPGCHPFSSLLPPKICPRLALSKTTGDCHPERYSAKDLAPIGEESRCFGVTQHDISRRISTEPLRPCFTLPSHRPERPAVLTAARTSKSFTAWVWCITVAGVGHRGRIPSSLGQPTSRNQ